MSITPFRAPSNTPFAGVNTAGTQPAQDRPKAQLWLNVGYDIVNAEGENVFIQLPNGGIPLDTMAEAPMRGQNEDFLMKLAAQNELLKSLVSEGGKLAPGGEVTLNLTIKMRRVNSEKTIPAGTNVYAVQDLASKLIAQPAQVEHKQESVHAS